MPTSYTTRTPVQGDYEYFLTQLGHLNDTLGNRLLFHSGVIKDQNTIYSLRTPI